MRIREFEAADTEPVVTLWEACGLTRPWNDPRADIARKLRVQPELFLVAVGAAGSAEGAAGSAEGAAGSAEGAAGSADASGIVASERGPVLGSVMAGYDGHRGWIYYLASDPGHRGRGIGRALVAEAERRLEAMGCPKVQLMVRAENTGVLAFYDGLGYEDVEVAMRGKRLIAD